MSSFIHYNNREANTLSLLVVKKESQQCFGICFNCTSLTIELFD